MYIAQQQLEDELGLDRLIQLTDEVGTGEVGTQRVERAISYAVGTFDSYARTRYTIPVPVTEKVISTCVDLAVFHLLKGRATIDDGVYKVRKDAHDQALSFLKDIASGKAGLDVPSAEETVDTPASPDEVLRGSSATPEVFSTDKLTSF